MIEDGRLYVGIICPTVTRRYSNTSNETGDHPQTRKRFELPLAAVLKSAPPREGASLIRRGEPNVTAHKRGGEQVTLALMLRHVLYLASFHPRSALASNFHAHE